MILSKPNQSKKFGIWRDTRVALLRCFVVRIIKSKGLWSVPQEITV